MGLPNEDVICSVSQLLFVFVGESSVASFDKIMVQSSIGVFWRTDGHIRKFQVVDGVGGDRGGDGILLPLLVRLGN